MVKLRKRKKDEYGNLYFLMRIMYQNVEIPAEIYELANKNGLSNYDLRRRIVENGFAVTQYVARPLADKTVKPLIEEDNEREQRIATREEQELRRKKPHLFNVKQKHDFGKYAQSLEENNLIARVKTDSYGRVQRG